MMYKLLIIATVILFSCNKEKPPIGNYSISLVYDNNYKTNYNSDINISQSDKKSITILTNSGNFIESKLEKDNKTIKGKINYLKNIVNGISLEGKWDHKFLSKKYTIKGRFIETQYAQGGSLSWDISGDFEITSK